VLPELVRQPAAPSWKEPVQLPEPLQAVPTKRAKQQELQALQPGGPTQPQGREQEVPSRRTADRQGRRRQTASGKRES
jgi:hypothetical protein